MPVAIAAIDQGTTSTRCLLFDRNAKILAAEAREHRQSYPRPGWVEHDPLEIWKNTQAVVSGALAKAGLTVGDVAAVGIANQRETAVAWEKNSGMPVHPAIVWQDTRTAALCERLAARHGRDRFRARTGLPLSSYFSGPKLRWLLDHGDDLRMRAKQGEILFGTIDTWLAWNLSGGLHVTDPTNASRTLLMDLETLDWDEELLQVMDVPRATLPEIRSSSEVYGRCDTVLPGVPIAGIIGDQQAALLGQCCFDEGDLKNTYGTGCFMLLNTGRQRLASRHGLLTTVAFRRAGQPPIYALEGSVAVAGALVQWLRDGLGLIASAGEVETLAASVNDSGGVYVVPAFSGLFAPYWRSDARGAILGLTRYAGKAHLARAALEAIAYQTADIFQAMTEETGRAPARFRVDGGMVGNDLLMQFQADILGLPIVRPEVAETTALGAAFAAGLAVGFWKDTGELRALWRANREWQPRMDETERARCLAGWTKAVARTLDWVDDPA